MFLSVKRAAVAVGKRQLRAGALVAALLLGAAAPVPASAHPRGSGLLQCEGTESVSYQPGITLRARRIHVTVDGQFASCVGGGGGDERDGGVKNGSYHEEFTLVTGCSNLLEGFKSRRTYTWNTEGTGLRHTGDSSTADISGSSTAVAGQVVTQVTGTIPYGRFRGHSLLQVIVLPQPSALQCLAGGLTGVTGATTLMIF
ncbi:hypothetical protein [Streptomyces sp. NPDC008001]|uniref:hypothetical protein n=1 Tax=Streptomyces sp. NPDC008001 TaxID=3364804 RepID=UPI0036E44CC7